jgi:hypothetical protein
MTARDEMVARELYDAMAINRNADRVSVARVIWFRCEKGVDRLAYSGRGSASDKLPKGLLSEGLAYDRQVLVAGVRDGFLALNLVRSHPSCPADEALQQAHPITGQDLGNIG